MLTLSKKFHQSQDYLALGYKPVFNPTKNKLTFRKKCKTHDISNLKMMVAKINALTKPIFTDIESYRTCHANIKSINKKIDRRNNKIHIKVAHVFVKAVTFGRRGIKTDRIRLKEFNQNLKPLSVELKNRIWAVHATKYLSDDGILHPFTEPAATFANPSKSEKALPAISNTIHFALGELVRPHKGGSWDSRTMAVVTPLSTIIDQAVNVFAHDTFITGNWALKPESIVLIPEEDDTPEWQDPPFTIIRYKKSEKTLRKAIDDIIKDQGGLSFRMQNQSVLLGSYAMLDNDININTESFFENLLQEYEGKLSFGDHTHSSTGDAYALGMMRQISGLMMDDLLNADEDSLSEMSSDQRYVYYRMLSFLYRKTKNKYFSCEEQKNFEQTILDQVKTELYSVTRDALNYLSPDFFNSFTEQELDQFMLENPILFQFCEMQQFKGSWACCRWMTIGYERGLKEGLDELIDKGFLLQAKAKPPLANPVFIMLLNNHMNKYTDRAEVVNHILNLQGVKSYKKKLGFLVRLALKSIGLPFPRKIKLS
ncbi:hypothetical protein [Parachlamydia acanthamoebae]|uniref:hypothetical protein n=1 Tax=Parachlamydia acanthamoebae TaxID=83552 RepID=UPI000750AF9E|nr:hypothetical protein [Parachlamydia acanthamoebae]